MTKRRADEPDNKAAERLKQFREARGLSDDCPPEEDAESTRKKTRKSSKNRKEDEGTQG